jgi:hypothetical protein
MILFFCLTEFAISQYVGADFLKQNKLFFRVPVLKKTRRLVDSPESFIPVIIIWKHLCQLYDYISGPFCQMLPCV